MSSPAVEKTNKVVMSPKSIPLDVESNYSSQEVINQLKLILSHELFSNSAVLSNFLKYIVEETLAGNLRSLKEYTIGVSGLGKKVDFNPQIDAIVRIHAGRLRRLLTEYYSGPGIHDKILIEVVKGSYVPVFSRQDPRQELPMMLSPAVSEVKTVTVSNISVAILPFRNLCPSTDYQFFVDGLGEEFTRVFSVSQEFAVIAHHSTAKHASLHSNLRTIAAKFNANYVITGTVMRNENHLRITVALLETTFSTQIWSKAFNYGNSVDFMDVQDQTTNEVYAVLAGPFGFIVRHRSITRKLTPDDAPEFDPVLHYYQFHTNFSFFTYAKTRKILEIIQQSVPQSPIPLAILSELYLWGHILGYPTSDSPVATSLQLAQKALNIEPLCKHANFSFLWASLCSNRNEKKPGGVEVLLKQNPLTHEVARLSMLLVLTGDYDAPATLLEEYMKTSPHRIWSFDLVLSLIYFNSGKYAEAHDLINGINATDIYLVDLLKIILLNKLGHIKEAKPYIESIVQHYSFIVMNLKAHLNNLILDKSLVDKLLRAARDAGVSFSK